MPASDFSNRPRRGFRVFRSVNSPLRCATVLLLAACAAPPAPVRTPPPAPAAPPAPAPKPAPAPAPADTPASSARTIDEYKRDAALRVHSRNAQWVHDQRPQALLRAVIVVRVKVDAAGRPQYQILRSPDSQMSARVQQSLNAATPLPIPPQALGQQLGSIGFVESWLFNSDGRFQLRTIAQPQMAQ